jgi:hypothetical protein
MPLSEQESRCVELACEFLSSAVGGRWAVESCLDDLNHTEHTPEVVVTNGETTAAIEVKMMAGDLAQRKYRESLYSNERYLVPSCGGYYWLEPPVDLRLPIGMALRRQVKREIERVSPALNPGDKGVLRIPRSGHISLMSDRNPAAIFCVHSGPYSDLWQPLTERLTGRFMLVDDGLEHSFFTDEGREAFYDTVASACRRRLGGDASTFTWNEEWRITRLEDGGEGDDEKDGVWIMACTEARSVPDTISECLDGVLKNALRKFTSRWANLHVLILEENVSAHTELIRETVAGLGPARLPNIDYVLLAAGDEVIWCYP